MTSPSCSAREVELLVGLVLHEVEVLAVAVEELHGPLLEDGARPLLAGLEGTLDGLAALDVAQLDAHLGGASAHLDVVVVEDLPELAVELDGDALAQVSGRDHGCCPSPWAWLDERSGRPRGPILAEPQHRPSSRLGRSPAGRARPPTAPGPVRRLTPGGGLGPRWCVQSPTTVTSRGKLVSSSRLAALASMLTRSSMRTPVAPSR